MVHALKKDSGTVLCYRKVNFSVNQPREHEAVITNRHIKIGIRHVKKMDHLILWRTLLSKKKKLTLSNAAVSRA